MAKIKYEDVMFKVEDIVNKLQNQTGVKLKLRNTQSPEYISIGQISEQDLLDFGFVFVGYSSYIKCPIYRYGKNIEAIFNETILHIYGIVE